MCLEVIVSEKYSDTFLERQTVQVLPEVGCAVDNMDTTKIEESIELQTIQSLSEENIIAFAYNISPEKTRLETVFGQEDNHRIRITVDIQNQRIMSPIRMMWERKTSDTSTGGTIADGGGLDGRTVSRLMGDRIRPKFVENHGDIVDDDGDALIRLPHSICLRKNSGEGGSVEIFLDGKEDAKIQFDL
eukprot:CAMPEP_0202456460 /NCGR_PEP_ID=MMETSP1360-20130828/13706_1 /ASSEMBLY_ACC=CAM_ASM_000848 /TAXON_ID=515479 /ORGANISM="Licmophora paradoxa, Strain CCMP2313" /LENGTH=187 /DNA_ID=CAMNT_0049076263 /DNA_START=476 /DNA_END=1039 /DNA_ORIENTATION=+